jgi:hypothetical protein
MQAASPATSGDVAIYLDYYNSGFIPVELGSQVLKLADSNLSPFATDADEFITVEDRIYNAGETDTSGLLSEFTGGLGSGSEAFTRDELGVLVELMSEQSGISNFNYDYVELADTVNDWYLLMNFEVPQEFS